MQREKPVNHQIYHVYNRGADKRTIFLDERDYFRFMHDLFEFNDNNPASFFRNRFGDRINHSKSDFDNFERNPRELLVDILAFCLMPNHFHLLLRQKKEDGITEFMRKIGTGYTNYFNQKQERSGVLFQGKYKSIRLDNQAHFIHLPFYIHSNPISLKFSDWQEKGIDPDVAMKFLENYKWSSFCDYAGKKNFPSITSREFLAEIMGEPDKFKKEFKKWLGDFNKHKLKIAPYLLEK